MKTPKLLARGQWAGGLALLLGLAACSPIRLLQPGERLLNTLEIEGADQVDRERLAALAQQKPNANFPLPKLAIYQLGNSFYDSVKTRAKLRRLEARYDARIAEAGTDSAQIGKLLNRREKRTKRKQLALDKGNAIMRLGEAPVVYDSALTRQTVEQMTTFLHSQGFFRGQVYATDTAKTKRGPWRSFLYFTHLRQEQPRLDSAGRVRPRRRITVTYHVREGQPFRYSQLTRTVPDSGVARVLQRAQGQSLLRVGDRYNEEIIGQERTRQETALRDAGYFDFRQQYITLEADTSFQPLTVRLRTLVANPENGPHVAYRLRRVRMITDAGVNRVLQASTSDTLRRAGTGTNRPATAPRRPVRLDTVTTDSVQFAAYKQKYSTRLLARKIMLRPGQLYSLSRTQLTQRKLSDLDIFRFNTVNFRKLNEEPADSAGADSTTTAGTGWLDAVINASPASKFQETTELGATYVANLVGPFGNERIKFRNPFGGAETLELGVRAGIEGQFTRVGVGEVGDNVYTTQFGVTAALVMPKFLVPFRQGHFLSRYDPKTRFTLSDTYVSRPEYTRTNVEFTFDYVWQKSAFHQYVFSPVVINVVNTSSITDAYRQRLQDLAKLGSPLFRSFIQLYVPSISASSLYNSNDFNQTRDARYLRLFAEVGGLTRDLYRNADWFNLRVYNFAKISVDYRRYHHLTPRTYLAWRLNGGAAHALTRTQVDSIDQGSLPLGTTSEYIIPYDKYFFAGGSNSVRAWKPRRLGPGSYATRLPTGERDFFTEQPGEVLLEGSVEYRFPIFSFIKGALFTDFGNVWSLQNDVLRPGAEFRPGSFYRQFAVGSGLGVRFDFTFLILRLDMAAKVYDPAANGWVLKKFYKEDDYGATFNLGIGYPF